MKKHNTHFNQRIDEKKEKQALCIYFPNHQSSTNITNFSRTIIVTTIFISISIIYI